MDKVRKRKNVVGAENITESDDEMIPKSQKIIPPFCSRNKIVKDTNVKKIKKKPESIPLEQQDEPKNGNKGNKAAHDISAVKQTTQINMAPEDRNNNVSCDISEQILQVSTTDSSVIEKSCVESQTAGMKDRELQRLEITTTTNTTNTKVKKDNDSKSDNETSVDILNEIKPNCKDENHLKLSRNSNTVDCVKKIETDYKSSNSERLLSYVEDVSVKKSETYSPLSSRLEICSLKSNLQNKDIENIDGVSSFQNTAPKDKCMISLCSENNPNIDIYNVHSSSTTEIKCDNTTEIKCDKLPFKSEKSDTNVSKSNDNHIILTMNGNFQSNTDVNEEATATLSKGLDCILYDEQLPDIKTVGQMPEKQTGKQLLPLHIEKQQLNLQTGENLPDLQTRELLSDIQSKEQLSGLQTVGNMPDVQVIKQLSDPQTTKLLPDPQIKDHLSDLKTTKQLPDPQTKDHFPDVQTKDYLPDLQRVEHLPGLKTTDSLVDLQTTDQLPDLHKTQHLPDLKRTEHLPDLQKTEHLLHLQNTDHVPDRQREHLLDLQTGKKSDLQVGHLPNLQREHIPDPPARNKLLSAEIKEQLLDIQTEKHLSELETMKQLDVQQTYKKFLEVKMKEKLPEMKAKEQLAEPETKEQTSQKLFGLETLSSFPKHVDDTSEIADSLRQTSKDRIGLKPVIDSESNRNPLNSLPHLVEGINSTPCLTSVVKPVQKGNSNSESIMTNTLPLPLPQSSSSSNNSTFYMKDNIFDDMDLTDSQIFISELTDNEQFSDRRNPFQQPETKEIENDGTKIVKDLIKELAQLNKFIIRSQREMENNFRQKRNVQLTSQNIIKKQGTLQTFLGKF